MIMNKLVGKVHKHIRHVAIKVDNMRSLMSGDVKRAAARGEEPVWDGMK